MPDRTTIVGALGSIGALLLVLELVRRRHLREEYALLWLATGAVLLLLSLSRPLLDTLAELTGIFYPPSALFLVALLFVLAILLHFSVILTRLTQQNRELAQQLALLRHDLERRASVDESHQHDDQGDVGDGVE
ncbi:MAG: DUF2304 domain-containing protein [Anaerolineaceae bacterium]|nr:DUF2304 domain-containing protein [Anaerolineaceae bacterium]MCY4024163.1 DUF2304 domain-containing protein [Anaerolineaceae bacterium]